MDYNIRYLPLAREDLQDVEDYVSGFYPSTSSHVMKALFTAISSLSKHPRLHEEYQENPYYRKMVVESYLVFYHVHEENQTVDIHRILHGARNIKRFLHRPKEER